MNLDCRIKQTGLWTLYSRINQQQLIPSHNSLSTVTQTKSSSLRKAGLFYLVFVMFSYTTGGPFGLEDMVTTSGPGITLLYLLLLPFFWCIPVSLVSAELTTAMPVEGGFYRWTRAAFGDFWGFLAGWWNWSASFLLGGAYAVLFADYLPSGSYEYEYLIRATTPGKFHLRPAKAFEMYFPETFGQTDGGWFEVKE